MSQPTPRWHLRGFLASLGGLALDLWAGDLILTGSGAVGLLVHVPAALLFTLGFALAAAPGTGEDLPTDVRWRRRDGWTIAALVISLMLFPGLGTGACAVAFVFSHLTRPRGQAGVLSNTWNETFQFTAVMRAAPVGTGAPVTHFVDALGTDDTERRRAVVQMLGHETDRESVRLIRRLLADPSPEVRGDAGVVLTRMENEYLNAIERARTLLAQDPQQPALLEDYARLCERYATNGMLDATSAATYLQAARDGYGDLVALAPGRADAWLGLARMRFRLEDFNGAWAALNQSLNLQPQQPDAVELGFAIAFRQGRWDLVKARSRAGGAISPALDPVLAWWAKAEANHD